MLFPAGTDFMPAFSRADQPVGKKKVRHRTDGSMTDFLRTEKPLFFQAGLLAHGSSSACAFPALRLPGWSVAYCRPCPRLQRWPNATDLHRIPFSPRPLENAAPGRVSFILPPYVNNPDENVKTGDCSYAVSASNIYGRHLHPELLYE